MTLSIKDWEVLHEHKGAREQAKFSWVRMWVAFDGDFYSSMMCEEDGPILLACWDSLIRLAATCSPRGTLIKSNGKPHDTKSIGARTRIDKSHFDRAIPFFLECGVVVSDDDTLACVSGSVDQPASDPLPTQPGRSNRPLPAPKKREVRGKKIEERGKKKRKKGDGPAPTAPGVAVPDFGSEPEPVGVLEAWDAIHLRVHGSAYMRSNWGREMKEAKKIIKFISGDGAQWQRIPDAMEWALADKDFLADKGFSIFVSQFSKCEIGARGQGTSTQKWDMAAHVAAMQKRSKA